MKVSVDKNKCVSSGQCVLRVPDVFDQSDDGTVLLLQPEPESEHYEAVRDAAHICPARAIVVTD